MALVGHRHVLPHCKHGSDGGRSYFPRLNRWCLHWIMVKALALALVLILILGQVMVGIGLQRWATAINQGFGSGVVLCGLDDVGYSLVSTWAVQSCS